ncbi:zinc finger, C3HC4 type (RING finger) protein (macronuclear) [Tetrahymena thermophila SB210]|uniref:RING-type E3 ubiquitin transferase n=1 Tax=Tetrahymena thermophila (strain SB210) TaxID=312017 RepID=Q247T4_TETTS|nr:zinc finger, C3HC4 type (RING finger) protein [Tetrahymena thermophila SB210]EAS04016.2 zinc finger, C3HC4 type (RING finger) protein [Tetrahymena thermophila SB210]|eukprot:XP_001024261.2 zinc finger, C3HC4 type (RING finger) protein [Tetrahymena thermophila SB210]
MGCLDNPRGQIIFEIIISLFVLVILLAGSITFVVIQDYELAFQIGSIVLLYTSSSALSLIYRARSINLITHENLRKLKFSIYFLTFLQVVCLLFFVVIISYCSVELIFSLNIWNEFNDIILQNNFSGNLTFYWIFLPIHLYYMIITIKLKKLLNSQVGQMNSPLLSENQIDGQVYIKTESVLSMDVPNEFKYDNTCSICQEDIQSGKIVSFECNHIFHSQCIRQWLKTKKNTCPNCRVSISISLRQSNVETFVQQSLQNNSEIQNIQIQSQQ